MDALLSRLRAASPVLLGSAGHPASDFAGTAAHLHGSPAASAGGGGDEAGWLTAALASAVHEHPSDERIWLSIVAFTTVFPTIEEHQLVRRALSLAEPGEELATLLRALEPIAARAPSLDAELQLVRGDVVIDADFSGRFDHNTGVQRVLRETVSRWAPEHDLVLAAWNDAQLALRELAGIERDRVLDWPAHARRSGAERQAAAQQAAPDGALRAPRILVPVDCVIVEIEVCQEPVAAPLAALAAVSGNRVVMVGHDTIPIVSAATQESGEIERFARYLTVVKHAAVVSGVSRSAATEFAGFVDALRAQGVTGPKVIAVPLAMNAPSLAAPTGSSPSPDARVMGPATTAPLVVVVGSQEPRKNHSAILFAAESLWNQGESFRLRFIGGGGALHLKQFDAEIARLQADGHPVEVVRGASDDFLVASYREARFTVFPSLHEGFGLPLVESLAVGTPVITADHGSLAEAAAEGGCLVVDPRDDEALAVAMRSLLNDGELYDRLQAEARERPVRGWDQYAAELWSDLVVPVRSNPGTEASDRGSAGHPTVAHVSAETARYAQQAVESWWTTASALAAERRARERSLVRKAVKVVPLTRFFIARSREMGVVPAGRAAFRIVRRRITSR